MSSLCRRVDDPERARLGRASWARIHDWARTLPASEFCRNVRRLVDTYGCSLCRQNFRDVGARWLDVLDRAPAADQLYVQVAASRMHADVTRNLLRTGEGVVSDESARFAELFDYTRPEAAPYASTR